MSGLRAFDDAPQPRRHDHHRSLFQGLGSPKNPSSLPRVLRLGVLQGAVGNFSRLGFRSSGFRGAGVEGLREMQTAGYILNKTGGVVLGSRVLAHANLGHAPCFLPSQAVLNCRPEP